MHHRARSISASCAGCSIDFHAFPTFAWTPHMKVGKVNVNVSDNERFAGTWILSYVAVMKRNYSLIHIREGAFHEDTAAAENNLFLPFHQPASQPTQSFPFSPQTKTSTGEKQKKLVSHVKFLRSSTCFARTLNRARRGEIPFAVISFKWQK